MGQYQHKRSLMYAEERQQAIASLVISQGRASVAELAQAYDVTTETVRRDLAVLHKAGVLRRVRCGPPPGRGRPPASRRAGGGAAPPPPPPNTPPPTRPPPPPPL